MYAGLQEIISTYKTKLNMEYSLKDIYVNTEQNPDHKSYTFNFVISAMDRTLEAKDIENFSNRLIQHMGRIGLTLRS